MKQEKKTVSKITFLFLRLSHLDGRVDTGAKLIVEERKKKTFFPVRVVFRKFVTKIAPPGAPLGSKHNKSNKFIHSYAKVATLRHWLTLYKEIKLYIFRLSFAIQFCMATWEKCE
jgi:hypothetical protein